MRALQEQIYACTVQHVETASNEELGEAIDMIKDLAEGIYYEQKTKLINKELECMKKEEEEYARMGKECLMHHSMPRDMDKEYGRMYYPMPYRRDHMVDRNSPYKKDRDKEDRYLYENEQYREHEVPFDLRDSREGRSPVSRRMYMESKEMHKDKQHKIKELEKYMQELSEDIVEMIEGASPEEKQMLEKKMTHLTSKIAQLNQDV